MAESSADTSKDVSETVSEDEQIVDTVSVYLGLDTKIDDSKVEEIALKKGNKELFFVELRLDGEAYFEKNPK